MPRSLTDFAKVIAAIAVVGIHATSQSEAAFAQHHEFFSLDFASVFVNQWARFSVPLFIYLSAYGLTLSDKGQESGFGAYYWGFFRKRLPTILIPYLFFSALAFALDYKNLTLAGVVQKLLRGGADYHLYFLVILAQCYLLFPLLLRMHTHSAKFFRILVLLSFVLVVLLLYRTSSERILGYLGLSHPGWHASFCIYWLPYFTLGILHARQAPSAWGTFTAIAAVLIALANVLADYVVAAYQGIPVDYYNHFSRPSVALYALAVIYMLYSVSHVPQKIAALAPLTFTVYLIHPQILRIMPGNWPTLITWLSTSAVAFGLAWGFRGLRPLINKIILSRKSA